MERMINQKYLQDHPDEVFVFGDNTIRRGKKGAAIMRDEPNSYGFITKKFPSFDKDAYYKANEYRQVFRKELDKLIKKIEGNPDKRYLISKLGAGLANKYGIWQKVIKEGLEELRSYSNVEYLYD